MAQRGGVIIFWLIITLLLVSAALALGLAFMVLGVDMKNSKNISFSLLTIIMFLWFITSIILRLILYFDSGPLAIISKIVTASYAMICPTMLLFAARCLNKRTWLVDVSWIILGLIIVAIALVSEPGTIQSIPVLDDSGYNLSYTFSATGYILALIYFIPGVMALIMLYKCGFNDDISHPYMMGGTFLILIGFLIGGFRVIPFPISPFVFAASLLMFGYAVLRLQIFNPLRENEEKQRAILDATTEFIMLINLEGIILSINRAAAEGFNSDPEEVVGKKITDLRGGNIEGISLESLKEMTEKRTPIQFQRMFNDILYDNSLYPVYDKHKNMYAIVIQAKDITELDRIGKEINNKNRDLEMFSDLSVDRELKMIELKKEVNSLLKRLDMDEKYQVMAPSGGGQET